MQIGSQAPTCSLYNTEKQKVSLSEFRGKTLLVVFFPFAFSSVCTAELCSLRDNLATYNQLNVQVIAISVDSLFTLARFKAEQHLDFVLLSDFNKEASRLFDVLYAEFPSYDMHGVSKRAAFIIDKEGTIRYAEVCASPKDVPDFAAIQQCLEGLY